MRRSFLLMAFFLIVVAVGASYLAINPLQPENNINYSTYDQIELQMTEKEVTEILGGPPGQYFNGKVRFSLPKGILRKPTPFQGQKLPDEAVLLRMMGDQNLAFEIKGWVSDRLGIWVTFDERGMVCRKEAVDVERITESVEEMFERWLGPG